MRFTTQGMIFDYTWDMCENPECACTEMRFRFTECDTQGRVPASALGFSAVIDIVKECEADPSPGSTLVRSVVEAFIVHARQERLFKDILREREDERHQARYIIPRETIERGTLVAYQELLAGPQAASQGGNRWSFRLAHGGMDWVIDDLYCPRPHCKCENVKLEAVAIARDPAGRWVSGPHFQADVTTRGKLTIRDLDDPRMSPALARAVVAALRSEEPDLLRELRRRWHTVKEVATRSLDAQPAAKPAPVVQPVSTAPVSPPVPARALAARETAVSPNALAVTAARVGRNDPCRCGSGKKFKKCCL